MQKAIKKLNKLKSEKGSITVFVLAAMLFLLMVVLITYVGISNKKQAQIAQIDKIKEEYESSLKDIDDIYKQEEGKYKVDITVSENGGDYFVAKGGTADLTANISINPKENINVVKREYGWSTSKEEEPNSYESFNGNQIAISKNGLNEGEYYLWVKVTTQEGAEIIQVSDAFKVEEQEIIIKPSTEDLSKGPMQVTIDYQSAYVNNKKIGIGATLEEAKQNAVANENTNLEISENCYIYVTAEDAYGNIGEANYYINNIDNQKPSVTLSPNGGTFKTEEETMTIDVTINVKDDQSGVDEVKYAWSDSNTEKPSADEYQTVENGTTIPSPELGEGKHYLWVIATDKVGNVTEEPSFEYNVVPPTPPTVALKENNATGAEYVSGTWTSQDVYHEITLPEEEGKVAKYQYSLDGQVWKDYSKAENEIKINYTTTFPVAEDNKSSYIGDLTNNGEYYFIPDGEGAIKPTNGDNQGLHSKTANSYIKIDLTTLPSDKSYKLTLNAEVSSESNYDYGYATITESTTAPSKSEKTGRFIYISGSKSAQDYSTTLTGGKVYYLHFGYYKDGTNDKNNDTFKVNSLSLKNYATESYETAFPILISEAPMWMGDLTNNGKYYFIIDGNGSIKPTNGDNQELHSTTANSYIKLDLSEYTANDKLNITINAEVSSESADYGYATITETETAPSKSTSTGRFIYISGKKSTQDYSTTLTGGKVYYLHFGYYKDSSVDSYDDTFKINKITFSSATMIKYANFYDCTLEGNKLTYTLKEDINREFYVKAIYEDGKSSGITRFKVQIDKTAPVINNYEVVMTSKTDGKLIISGIKEEGSGVAGYYISTNEEVPTKESNWEEVTEVPFEINNLTAGNTYYVWVIDKVGHISEVLQQEFTGANYKIDSNKYTLTLEQALALAKENSTIELLNDYTDSSTATIDKSIKLDTKQYTLTRTVTTNVKGTTDVPITLDLYGKITNSGNIVTLTTSGTVNLKGTGTIENVPTNTSSSYRAISNSGTLTQDGNITVSGYYYGIYNTGTYTLNSGKVISNYNSSSSYAIYNSSSGDIVNINGGEVVGYSGIYNNNSSTTNINGGQVKGTNSYGIRQYAGTVTINNGETVGKSTGIYINDSGTTNVIGGKVEGNYGIQTRSSSSTVNITGGIVVGSTYGIYGYTTGTEENEKITIGDINTEVNEKQPIVSGGQYGVYMDDSTYSYNFYNGVIMGTNAIPYTDIIKPREGYMIYTYYDYDGAKRYCSVLTQTVENITITQYPTEWTNQDVEVTIRYPSVEGATNQYSENGTDWIDVENGARITVSENKTIYARMLDSQGILIEPGVVEHKVENIDKIAPEVVVSTDKTKYTILEENEKVDITYSISASDEGGSNLKEAKYAFVQGNEELQEYQDITNGLQITENLGKGTYYLWLKVSDNAGNVSDITKTRFIVDLKEPVAQIGDTVYETIQDAFDAAGQTPSTVIILKDTDEVATLLEGQTVTLDLQGHTVGNSKDEAVITNNGTLTIIDTSSEKTGTIDNLVGTGIENNGTLTIGDNSNAIEDAVPTIKGNKIGIQNNSTLNYYDGTIIGKSAISGEVQSTPENYGPVGVYENGMTTVNLRVVSDYVARIDWFYYTTLQSAFDACQAKENNTEQTTVHILKDIVLDSSVNVYYGQNIILNLNSFSITSLDKMVIINYGKLEIEDYSQDKKGKIYGSLDGESNSYNEVIYNMGNIKISNGEILNEKTKSYTIWNQDGKIDICNGKIKNINNNSSTYTIYNTGSIKITGGEIIAESSYSSSTPNIYGIYNYNKGIVNFLEGKISVGSSSSRTSGNIVGIYNDQGTINVISGEINNISENGQSAIAIYNNINGYINIIDAKNVNLNCDTGITNQETGKIFIKNSEISYKGYMFLNNVKGTVQIEDSLISKSISENEIKTAYGINNNSGTIDIYKTKIDIKNSEAERNYVIYTRIGVLNLNEVDISITNSSETYGIYNYSNGVVNLNKTNIKIETNRGYGIYNSDEEGKIDITNSNINIETKTSNYCVGISNNGILNFNSGKIETSSKDDNYGISNSTTGIANIGVKDGTLNNDNLMIKSINTNTNTLFDDSYGFENRGIFNFYDGKIWGQTVFGQGEISEIEDNCIIKGETIEGFDVILLEYDINTTPIIINENTGEEYTSIQKAIDSSENGIETRLKVIQDFEITCNCKVPENKDIILDINGKTITNRYMQINNRGKFKIKDSTNEGKINVQEVAKFIKNEKNAVLTLENVNIISSMNTYENQNIILNKDDAIVNILDTEIVMDAYSPSGADALAISNSNGQVNIERSKISIDSDTANGIRNDSGKINIIESQINAVSNRDSGTLILNNNGENYIKKSKFNIEGALNNLTVGIDNSGELATIDFIQTELSIKVDEGYEAISNNKNAKMNLVDSNIIVEENASKSSSIYSCYGIYNAGILNITGGEININSRMESKKDKYGIGNFSEGIITLGINGDGINNSPIIKILNTEEISANSYGVYNKTGKFYFYDGIIEATTLALAPDTGITEWEDGSNLKFENNNTRLSLTMESIGVAMIGDKTYTSLQDAIDMATEMDTIEIIKGIRYSSDEEVFIIQKNKSITVDLNGNSIISAVENPLFSVEGNLKIIDTSEEKNGSIVALYKETIYVKKGGICEISGGNINNNLEGDTIRNEGTVNINGGNILQQSSTGYGINNFASGVINMYEGSVTAKECAIYNIGETNIINGIINGNTNGIINTDTGMLNIENATIEVKGVAGNIAIKNDEFANINIVNATINVTGYDHSLSYGIKNSSSGTINIAGGIINLKDSGYGIYSTNGNVIIGVKDGNVEIDSPNILGKQNGIYVSENCILNFYDGIIKGNNYAISGNINEIEENSELAFGEEIIDNVNYKTITLRNVGPIAEVGTVQYDSIKKAISSISDTGTITVLRDGIEAAIVDIPSEKNITIDLNGYELKMYNKIQNNGTLTITDNSEGAIGILSTYKDSPIYNNGTLTIENGNISGNTYGIYNQAGTATVVGGNIADNTYGLYAKGGAINVTGGNIQGNQYGIFASLGTINISQGNFTSNEYGVYNSSGTTNITGITLNVNTNNIYNGGSGTINIPSGNIITADSTVIENASSGTIVIGEEGGTPSKESPLIQAEEYAIKNTGSGAIKFYDGIIKGRRGALEGVYLYTETGYRVKTDYIDRYYCDTLTPSGTVTTVAKIGNVEYSNLQSAINACTSQEETTIQLVNSISSDSTFQIEEGQNIVIDLNGKTIETATAQTLINNAGTLKVIDTSSLQVGKITNETYNAIENSGTLTLGVDDGTVSTTCPEIIGKAKAIINTGTLNLYDGIIKGATALEGTAVSGKPSGYIMVKTREETTGYEAITLSR